MHSAKCKACPQCKACCADALHCAHLIKDIENALDKILKIRGVRFKWNKEKDSNKNFPKGKHYGVIAQEIEKILPEVVKKGPDGEKAVSYQEFVPILIEAIKEQQKEINELKMKLNEKY